MSYAAINGRVNMDAQQLSKGGELELVTIVWFLIVHFGFGDQFKIEEDHSRATFVVDK